MMGLMRNVRLRVSEAAALIGERSGTCAVAPAGCVSVALWKFESASVESPKGARPGGGNGRLSQSARVVLSGLGGVSLRVRY